jgi:6-phosphogluconolactonase
MPDRVERPNLRVIDVGGDKALAEESASFVVERINQVLAHQALFTLALSGGTTPWAMLDVLRTGDVPWDRLGIFQVDERIAPAGDTSRNITQMAEHLPAAANVDPMPVELSDLDAAAASYAARIPRTFDLIHLGLGPDGHTASLVPNDPVLDVTDRDVAVTTNEYQGHRRMTLTFPVLDRAAQVMWLVRGDRAPDALKKLRAGDTSIPGGRVSCRNQVLFTD